MFHANPRLAVLFATLTAIGLVSATSVLLAYPAEVVASPGLPVPETGQGLSESSPEFRKPSRHRQPTFNPERLRRT